MVLRLFVLYILFCSNTAKSQSSKLIVLNFDAYFENTILMFNKYYAHGIKDSISIEQFKFYISKIELLNNNQIVFEEKNSYHLLDLSVDSGKLVPLTVPTDLKFSAFRFQVGIDSITNVSGALGGDLDPTKGMYWTWQNGYINFKLEGKSNLCKTRHTEFAFHLGGYASPFNTLKQIELPIKDTNLFVGKTGKLNIQFDVQQFFKWIDLSENNHIMSPGVEAATISILVSKLFSIR